MILAPPDCIDCVETEHRESAERSECMSSSTVWRNKGAQGLTVHVYLMNYTWKQMSGGNDTNAWNEGASEMTLSPWSRCSVSVVAIL